MHEGLERRLVEARKLRPKKAAAGGVHPMAVDVPATTHLANLSAADSSGALLQLQAELDRPARALAAADRA
jgi:hypothetical protein